jgi:tRNA threonylcarbamoyl adenosine modification protein (Sua5/YciO/YrdC/YwlC family)
MTATAGDIERAADAALRGELIVIPTDTVYGIGTRPDDAAATARLFAAKRRPRDLELPVLVPDVDAARRIGRFTIEARRLARRFWPGALTLVVPRSARSSAWDLGGNPDTVGIRVPADPTGLDVLRRTGPLAVTSANISGSPTPVSCEEIARLFGNKVAVTLCADGLLSGQASTVVDCTLSPPALLREGSIGIDQIHAATRAR